MPTNVVVDSSVAIKWFLPEPHDTVAKRLLDGYRQGWLTLLAPDLIDAEVGNILWKRHQFHGLDEVDARQILAEFRSLQIVITPNGALLEEAFRLAVLHRRTVYDSLYLALSEREHCPFVTADERFANAVSAAFPSVVWLPNWP
jgi:predicted nucleic acid-binding protein